MGPGPSSGPPSGVNIPLWQPYTEYPAGFVVQQGGALYSAKVQFTSGAVFNAANWTAVTGGTGTFLATAYGVKADGNTVVDGAINGNQLSSAGTQFASGDVGKLAVVVGAGAPTQTQLSGALTNGTPVSSLTVAATPAAFPAGGIVLNDGAGHTQSMVTTGAAQGATSLPLAVSTTPNFSYPTTTTVTTMTPALSTTIQSVSGGVATLAAPAGTNIASGAEVFYATDDTAAAQAAITAAEAVNGVAEFPTGQIGLSAALTQTGGEIAGQGVYELYGTAAGGYNALGSFPVIAPFLSGTVLVQCAPATDIIRRNGIGTPQHVRGLGLRFAGKYVNTGHGVSDNPAAYLSGQDQGPMSSTLRDVVCYGHDGNHYAFSMMNNMYPRYDNLRGFGGGGMHFAQNTTPAAYGNATGTRLYFNTYVAGTAHAFHSDNQRGTYLDYCQWFNLQCWLMSPVAGGGTQPANTVAPTVAQFALNTTGTHLNVGFVGPDMESNIAGKVQRPSGSGCYWLGDDTVSNASVVNVLPRGAPPQSPQDIGRPASGTSYQNQWGNQLHHANHFSLQPLAAASATSTLSSATAYKATVLPVVSGTGFAAGQGVQIDSGATVEFRIIASVAANNITLTTPCQVAHASGVTVQAGAAVILGQVSGTTLAANQTNPFMQDMAWAPIGDTVGRSAKIGLFVPTNWFMRLDWANATQQNTVNASSAR